MITPITARDRINRKYHQLKCVNSLRSNISTSYSNTGFRWALRFGQLQFNKALRICIKSNRWTRRLYFVSICRSSFKVTHSFYTKFVKSNELNFKGFSWTLLVMPCREPFILIAWNNSVKSMTGSRHSRFSNALSIGIIAWGHVIAQQGVLICQNFDPWMGPWVVGMRRLHF